MSRHSGTWKITFHIKKLLGFKADWDIRIPKLNQSSLVKTILQRTEQALFKSGNINLTVNTSISVISVSIHKPTYKYTSLPIRCRHKFNPSSLRPPPRHTTRKPSNSQPALMFTLLLRLRLLVLRCR